MKKSTTVRPGSVFLFRGKLAILFKDLAKGMAGALILEDGLSTGPGANRFDAGNELSTGREFRGTQSLFPQNAATIFNALAKLSRLTNNPLAVLAIYVTHVYQLLHFRPRAPPSPPQPKLNLRATRTRSLLRSPLYFLCHSSRSFHSRKSRMI